jgi:aryl-alcohol dehydrogenase-like predicted oxidoreductase
MHGHVRTRGDPLAGAPLPAYGPGNDDESIATIHHALDIGVTFVDTADMYGSGHNEQLSTTVPSGFGRLATPR